MTWQPINLAAEEFAKPSDPPNRCGLIYEGKRHLLSGPPEVAKTLISFVLAIEEIRAGGFVAIIDFESGPVETRRLLLDLGATVEELQDGLVYFEPDGPPTAADLGYLENCGTTLAIIDALAGAYDASGLDDSSRKDAERFARTWINPLWKRGIGSIAIDHVTKNADTRGKFSIGSERKLGSVDVHLGLKAIKQLRRGTSGLVRVSTHKDRPAHLQRPYAADIELHSDPETSRIGWTIKPVTEGQTTDGFRPTALMERVSRYVELYPDGATRTSIYNNVIGKREYLVLATNVLVAEGYLVPDGSRLGSRRIYRDDSPGSPGSQAVPGGSPVPDSPSVPPVPPPIGGNGNQEGTASESHVPQLGDDGYLDYLFVALERQEISENFWLHASKTHREVAVARSAA